jgi:hypothetical protein
MLRNASFEQAPAALKVDLALSRDRTLIRSTRSGAPAHPVPVDRHQTRLVTPADPEQQNRTRGNRDRKPEWSGCGSANQKFPREKTENRRL